MAAKGRGRFSLESRKVERVQSDAKNTTSVSGTKMGKIAGLDLEISGNPAPHANLVLADLQISARKWAVLPCSHVLAALHPYTCILYVYFIGQAPSSNRSVLPTVLWASVQTVGSERTASDAIAEVVFKVPAGARSAR